MSDDKRSYSLAEYVTDLKMYRDQSLQLSKDMRNEYSEGKAAGLELALALLKVFTQGDFGQSIAEQNAERANADSTKDGAR